MAMLFLITFESNKNRNKNLNKYLVSIIGLSYYHSSKHDIKIEIMIIHLQCQYIQSQQQ